MTGSAAWVRWYARISTAWDCGTTSGRACRARSYKSRETGALRAFGWIGSLDGWVDGEALRVGVGEVGVDTPGAAGVAVDCVGVGEVVGGGGATVEGGGDITERFPTSG